jgi:hypothetical protein
MSQECPVCHQQFVGSAQVAISVAYFAGSLALAFSAVSLRSQRVRLVFSSPFHAALFVSLLSEQVFASPVGVLASVAFGIIRQRGCVVVLSGFRCMC